jgi:hypothetical protein
LNLNSNVWGISYFSIFQFTISCTTSHPAKATNTLHPDSRLHEMTTFIPSLTIPAAVFANPAASILLPIALGSAVGWTVSRKSFLP